MLSFTCNENDIIHQMQQTPLHYIGGASFTFHLSRTTYTRGLIGGVRL